MPQIESIQIRNPRVKEIVAEERQRGTGRSFAETAENLILEAAESRRLKRASAKRPSRRREKATA